MNWYYILLLYYDIRTFVLFNILCWFSIVQLWAEFKIEIYDEKHSEI